MQFEFIATIGSSFLTSFDDPLAPISSELFGSFSYDPASAVQSGSAYYFDPGEAELSVYTAEGFELTLDNRVTNVAPSESGDSFTVQSFVSEDPNGWHIVLDIFGQDWLGGSTDLPTSFPNTFDSAAVSVYFTDEFDWVQTIDATITSIMQVGPDRKQFAETGTLLMNHQEVTVTLQQSYENPVVIAFVATENGPHPVNVRVNSVSDDSLSMQLQEPSNLDGWHVFETVNYMVIEAGTWVLPDGTIFQAGTLASNQLSPQGFNAVTFDAAFDAPPIVLSQVQTANGPDFVTTRQQGASKDGIQITMQEEEALNSGAHVTETIGWVAIDAGNATAGDLSWWAAHLDGINHENNAIQLGALTGDVHAIASLSSFNGQDTAWVRGNGGLADGFSISVEEETSRDRETWHVEETVDYFVFDGIGILTGSEYDTII